MGKILPSEIVEAYVAALSVRDFAGARARLSNERFSSRSPISSFDSADAFIDNISRIGPILEKIERRKTFVDGNEVCVVLDYITRMDQRLVSPVVHLMRVEDSKITSIESFFDAHGYVTMFDVE